VRPLCLEAHGVTIDDVSWLRERDPRASTLSDPRLWLLATLTVGLFALDVALPEVVLLPFTVIPVVAAAVFASARATAALGALALLLGVVSGVVNGDFQDDDYWFRLAGMVLVTALAVYLSWVATRRERRLAEGESRLRVMLDNTVDSVFLLDADGVVRWGSPAVREQLGYEPDDLVGTPWVDLVHYEDRRPLPENTRRASRGEQVRCEERLRLASGQYRWMSVVLRPFDDGGRSPGWYVAAMRDIDEDVLLRDALSRSERMLRMAMDGAANGMAVIGLHQRFFEVNQALCQLVGRDALWLADHGEDEILHPDEVEDVRMMRDRLLAGQAEQEARRTRLVTADGTIVEVAYVLGLLRDEYGLPLFFLGQYTASGTVESGPSTGPDEAAGDPRLGGRRRVVSIGRLPAKAARNHAGSAPP
jgi:PAS domain S-box-containing protein